MSLAIISTQEDLILRSLLAYYTPGHLDRIMPYINKTSRISLRLIDWFTTNYAKKFCTSYVVESTNGDRELFKVYSKYKDALDSYTKKRFDPFQRHLRVNVPYRGDMFVTTIGQLNFFRWTIEYGVLEYIETHFDDIDRDMNERNNSSSRRNRLTDGVVGTTKTRKRREELSVSASKTMKREDVEIVVSFK